MENQNNKKGALNKEQLISKVHLIYLKARVKVEGVRGGIPDVGCTGRSERHSRCWLPQAGLGPG